MLANDLRHEMTAEMIIQLDAVERLCEEAPVRFCRARKNSRLSPATEATDRGVKFQDYAAHGVREYWLIDPDQEFIEQFALQDDAYTLLVKVKTGTLEVSS